VAENYRHAPARRHLSPPAWIRRFAEFQRRYGGRGRQLRYSGLCPKGQRFASPGNALRTVCGMCWSGGRPTDQRFETGRNKGCPLATTTVVDTIPRRCPGLREYGAFGRGWRRKYDGLSLHNGWRYGTAGGVRSPTHSGRGTPQSDDSAGDSGTYERMARGRVQSDPFVPKQHL